MINNIFVVNKHSQIKSIGTEIKFQIINEIIQNPATCQQLAIIFDTSKQKIHYNLKILLDEGLIQIENTKNDSNEKYYRAKAKNYVIDFSVGSTVKNENQLNNRGLINTIIEHDHNIELSKIAANILENNLKMRSKEKLLIVYGEYNMRLVEKILIEASKRQIDTTLMYRNKEMLEAKHNSFSLATYSWDFKRFNKALKNCDVYLYLNGESRFIPLSNPDKKKIQQKAFAKSRDIVKTNNVKIAMMEGLMKDELSETNILSEINFWKSLNVDYVRLANETKIESEKFFNSKSISIENKTNLFSFEIEKIRCDYGSFTDLPNQSPLIFLPGGEVFLIPKEKSCNGILAANAGYIYGKSIKNPIFEIVDNRIINFQADSNMELIEKAISEAGEDGGIISLISIGTNYNMNEINIDPLYKSKSKGVLTIRWGENVSIGGSVKGGIEWQIQLDNPIIKRNH